MQELRVDEKQHFLDSYHQIKPITEGRKRREKDQSYLTLFGRSRIWFFFCQKEVAKRRASEHTKLKSSEFSENLLGWSSQNLLTGKPAGSESEESNYVLWGAGVQNEKPRLW